MTRAAAQFKVAPGIHLAADTFGDPAAPTLLMLHGGGQTRHAWHATATSLADAGWRAITVDLRGHGESTHPRPAAYALEDFAADVRALTAAIAEDPVVIGASLGGIAGLLALTESPTAPAAALILVDVAHRFQPRGGGRIVSFMEEHPNGFATLSDAADAVAAYLPRRARPRDTNGLRHNLRRNDDGRWIWHWDPEMLTQVRPLLHDQAQLSKRLTGAATKLCQPCLLVRGADSDVLSAGIAREFAELVPTATLSEVPCAGHMVAGNNNGAFTAAIRTWLDAFATHTPPTQTKRHLTTTSVDRTRVETFLRTRGAERLVHPGGSLYEHLCRVSIAGDGPVAFRDRFTGRVHTPSQREVRAFVEITAANELDALAHNHALLAEHGADLFTLFTGARNHLSDTAWRACVDLLDEQGERG